MDFQYFKKKIADVKIKDILTIFPFMGAFVLSKVIGKKYRNFWLVCEDAMEARDNGYWFFKYLCENTDVQCCYAIKSTSPDYHKVEELGPLIEYGSFKHWLVYLSCKYNISSQKGGKPNAALCAFLELNNIVKVKNVFLQHGVTINDAKWLYAKNSKIDYFITATSQETTFIRQLFGYKEQAIQYTGFSRFDNLHNFKTVHNRILIMPSWRAWFYEKSAQIDESDADFAHSDYLRYWKELISSSVLNQMIHDKGLEVIFYPHRNMQPFLHYFDGITDDVTIASCEEYDVQELLKSSELLITDYSSVFFDMVYMKKPVVFFQFDEEKFRKQQYQKGYFDYHNTAFGDYCTSAEEVLSSLSKHIEDSYAVTEEFLLEHSQFFEKYDTHNSRRIYEVLSVNLP